MLSITAYRITTQHNDTQHNKTYHNKTKTHGFNGLSIECRYAGYHIFSQYAESGGAVWRVGDFNNFVSAL